MITTHGFRSTFRDWSADKTDYPREVCEHVLAHKLPDEIEAYYLRGRYLEKLMADWAIYIMHKLIYAELSGDFPLGDSRQPTYKSLRPFDLVS